MGIFNVYISETIDKRYFPILFIETPQKLYQLCDFVVVHVINFKSKKKVDQENHFQTELIKFVFESVGNFVTDVVPLQDDLSAIY